MMAKKNKDNAFGAILIADRFEQKTKPKKYIQRNSVTEFTNISMLSERLSIENKPIFNAKVQEEEVTIEERFGELINTLNYDLSIPPRVPFFEMDKEDYKEVELYVFNRWKYMNKDKVFERNIEIWRQFWLTCERSDTIAQIIDARNPTFFMNEDIVKMYPEKKHILLKNKSDLIKESTEAYSTEAYSYSTKDEYFNFNLEGKVGLIGYPNVGKSSTINLILKQKKVKVSATPGKTKYIQTIETPNFTLLDCPGLVFPKHSKIDLVLMGILNVDQIPELNKYEDYIIERVGAEKIRAFYKLLNEEPNVLLGMSIEKGWVKSKSLKMVTKDYAMGNIAYY